MKNIYIDRILFIRIIILIILIILIIIIYYCFNFNPIYSLYPKFPKEFYNAYSHLSLNKVIKNCNKLKNNHYKQTENIVFLFSFDYKTMPYYYNKMKETFIKYCNQHGYKFLLFDHSNDQNKISPYWNRVSDLVKLSNQYNSDTIFIYLDLDTYINPKYSNISIDEFLNSIDNIENKVSDIYIGIDPYHTSNAGIIIIRNTEWSKQFLNLWWSKYNPKNWIIQNNKWVCKQDKNNCEWAGKGYEQGEFNIIYNNNEIDSQNHIRILHNSLISNNNLYIDSFIYHFYGTVNIAYPFLK